MNYNHDDIKKNIANEINDIDTQISSLKEKKHKLIKKLSSLPATPQTIVKDPLIFQQLSKNEKIQLFRSLFRGRDDVYAKRWQNKTGRSGYSPVCLNEWQRGICGKPKTRCADCEHKLYATLDAQAIENHLRGGLVVGIYPLLPDENCYFLAIDFDDTGWEKDVSVVREVCREFNIPMAVERSRSGNGAHVWFFFEDCLSATRARKFGSAVITYAMNKRHEISFASYDRFFPNQDTMPKGGMGNLIALPLQLDARKTGHSIFIDEKFNPYEDQWGFLSSIKKLSGDTVESLISKLCTGNELGILKEDEEEKKPWLKNRIRLTKADYPKQTIIVKADMLYINKEGFSSRALNALKRLSAFRNPEFYKAQAMRMPTYNKPRVISCFEDKNNYLCLPRGCEGDINVLLNEYAVEMCWDDQTNRGRDIKVEFKGVLREEQQEAVDELLKFDNGILSATTAFGKTVIAAKLIAERKVNTLILVHRQQLLLQWIVRLLEFLIIDEKLPVPEKKRGRKKKQSVIGRLGGGKDSLSGIIDIAIMQSLNDAGEVKEIVKNYGMAIVDECHHIPAFSFEQILKKVNAKYVYGLTATPVRQDGHHPILFMHCGPIRYKVDARKQAEQRPFEHYVIPRFTGFRIAASDDTTLSIQELYAEMAVDEMRNQLLVDDVINSYENGRNCLVLTGRTAHVELLAKKLAMKIPDVIVLRGGLGAKETNDLLGRIAAMPQDKQLTIVATGTFIGEGFDAPRLDTLFLAMPISWKGTLHQYAGRLHRIYETKKHVQIYDYVDVRIRMLEKMYAKRLTGYAAIGYKAQGESLGQPADIIFNKNTFFPVYCNDLVGAKREIVIVSPFVTQRRVNQIMQNLSDPLNRQVKITIITRPSEELKEDNKLVSQRACQMLQDAGITIMFRPKIHQKFAVIDQKIVWYGSINLLSFGSSEESIMRLVSGNIAYELTQGIDIHKQS
ncbi:MAG: DEAD/DEAH box helicase family protein [Candidatus Omnitrophica bacterium]|nr:DEAD/DEAH box helicase family protein [Candidatus Omnitrophota bacterium]